MESKFTLARRDYYDGLDREELILEAEEAENDYARSCLLSDTARK